MKAIQIRRFGGPDVFEIAETSTPTPGPGQVLIRVHAAGINFSETLMRKNRYAMTPVLPAILGNEIAGTIEAVGDGVAGLVVGARVAAPLFAAGMYYGGYAEFALIDAEFVAPLPDTLSFEDATALMVQGLTALYLIKHAPPKGKTVLISAAAGGVGSILVQLAKRAGAKKVIAAASTPEKRDFARSLGADSTVDYAEITGSPDIIYESVGGEVTKKSLEVLAPLGQLVIYGALNIQEFQLGVPELLGLIFKNQSVTGFAVAPLLTPESLRAGLAELFELVAAGQLKITIGGIFPFERVAEAHRALEDRRTTGKLVLVPSQNGNGERRRQ